MQKLVLAPLAMLLVAVASAHGEEQQAGRYQMVAVPASQSQTFPQTLLLDTGDRPNLDPVSQAIQFKRSAYSRSDPRR
jgi:hypothetical protein